MKTLRTTLLICTFLLMASASYCQQRVYRQLDSIFNNLYKSGSFSGNVLIAKNGQPVYQKSFGFADSSEQIKNENLTRFLLASVSKQFTAAGIVLLKEAGKLNYDDKLVKYLPALPYPEITIRQLLNHTSGVPDYLPVFDQYWDKTKFATNDDMLDILIKYHPDPFFEPGQKYLYSNTGYALLASVIEKVSGVSFTDYMEDKVFRPFGLKHTLVYTRRARPKQVPNCATGYVYEDSLKRFIMPEQHPVWKHALWEDGIYGEDGVNSTVSDILLWDQAVFNRTIISAEDWKEILGAGKPAEGDSDYGFGWHLINPQGKGRIAYHTGGWPGFQSYNEQGLDQNYTIIILRNKFAPRTKVPVEVLRSIINSINY